MSKKKEKDYGVPKSLLILQVVNTPKQVQEYLKEEGYREAIKEIEKEYIINYSPNAYDVPKGTIVIIPKEWEAFKNGKK